MPTYEYRCNACEAEFEVQKRMSDPVDAACPHCGSDRTQRLISHSSFVLKGSGWYVTDYARKNGGGGGGSPHKDHSHASHEGSTAAADAKAPAPATAPAPAPAPAAAPKPASKPSATAPASPSSSQAG